MVWSLLCDPIPSKDVKTIVSGGFEANSDVANMYGERNAIVIDKNRSIFIAHRGIACVLETFDSVSGGSIKPLMLFATRDTQHGLDAQQVQLLNV